MHNDSTSSIFRSAKRFFGGTTLSRISGMIRDILMAAAWGAHESVAAFFVAYRLAHLLRRVLGEGGMQSALIPYFETLRKEDPARAATFFRDLSLGLTTFLIAIILLTISTLGFFLWTGYLTFGNEQIVSLTALLMPSLLFICLFGINASLLQCEKSYFTSGAAPTAFNAIWILGILSLWNWQPEQAMPLLAFFVILGCLGQWLFTLPKTLKILKNLGLNDFWSNIKLWSKDLRGLLKPLFLGIIGIAASQVNNALDAIFARYADLEGPAFLWYAIRIQQLPLALVGIAISSALLPPLSRAIKNHDMSSYKHFLNFALRRATLLMLPATLILTFGAPLCVGLLYGRGDFDSAATSHTSYCLIAYAIGLIPMTYTLILAPAFYAANDYKTPTQASLVAIFLNIALNTLFVMGFGWGAFSIALATSISAAFNAVQLFLGLRRQIVYA